MADLMSLSVLMTAFVFSSFSSFFGLAFVHRIPDRFREENKERPEREDDGRDPDFSSPCPETLFTLSFDPGTPRESVRIRLGLALPFALNVGDVFRELMDGFKSCIASLDPRTFHFCLGDVISDSLRVEVLLDAWLVASLFGTDGSGFLPAPEAVVSGLVLLLLIFADLCACFICRCLSPKRQ